MERIAEPHREGSAGSLVDRFMINDLFSIKQGELPGDDHRSSKVVPFSRVKRIARELTGEWDEYLPPSFSIEVKQDDSYFRFVATAKGFRSCALVYKKGSHETKITSAIGGLINDCFLKFGMPSKWGEK